MLIERVNHPEFQGGRFVATAVPLILSHSPEPKGRISRSGVVPAEEEISRLRHFFWVLAYGVTPHSVEAADERHVQ